MAIILGLENTRLFEATRKVLSVPVGGLTWLGPSLNFYHFLVVSLIFKKLFCSPDRRHDAEEPMETTAGR